MSNTSGKDRPIPNSYWVMPGRLAAGEYPGEVDPRDAAAKLRCLLEAGINHFVDLTEPGERTDQGELAPYHRIAEEEADDLNVTVQCAKHPIPDTQVPDTPGAMAAILDAIDSAVDQGRTVYIHCWGGVGRTGTVVGCWLVRHGCSGEEALAQIADWWQGVAKASRSPPANGCSASTFGNGWSRMDRTLNPVKRGSKRRATRNWNAWQLFSPDGQTCRFCLHSNTDHLSFSGRPHFYRPATKEERQDPPEKLYRHQNPEHGPVLVKRVTVAKHAELVTAYCRAAPRSWTLARCSVTSAP